MKQIEIKITDRQSKKDFSYPWTRPAPKAKPQDLDPGMLRSMLRNNLKQNFENLVLVGNPFLHPRLEQVLKISGELRIQTRAIQVNPSVSLKKWIKKLQKNRFDYLIFNLAGPDARTNDQVLGAGAFASFKRNLTLARHHQLNVEVHYLVTSANYQLLAEIIQLAETEQFSLLFSEAMLLGDLARRQKLIPDPVAVDAFWEALVSWKSLNPKLDYLSGFSNYLANQQPCRYSEILFLNPAGQFQKCWLDSYFPKQENNLENSCCQACFNWPRRRPPARPQNHVLSQADQRLIQESLAAFTQLQQQPANAINSQEAAYALTHSSLKPGQLNKITQAYQLIKTMQGLGISWPDFYRRREFNNLFILGSASDLKYPGLKTKTSSRKRPPTYAQLIKDLQALSQQGIPSVTFAGGDILLYPQISQLLKVLEKQKQTATLVLDGWNFKRHQQRLLKAPVDYYLFEIFGAVAATHDQLVGRPQSHEKIMDALELLLDPGEEQAPGAGLCYILTKTNYQEMEQMLEFASMLEIGFFILPADQKFPGLSARFKPSARIIRQAQKLCRDYVAKNNVTQPRVIEPADINPVTYPF